MGTLIQTRRVHGSDLATPAAAIAYAAGLYGITVTQSTLRSWVKRGNISRVADGTYDIRTLDAYLARRKTAA